MVELILEGISRVEYLSTITAKILGCARVSKNAFGSRETEVEKSNISLIDFQEDSVVSSSPSSPLGADCKGEISKYYEEEYFSNGCDLFGDVEAEEELDEYVSLEKIEEEKIHLGCDLFSDEGKEPSFSSPQEDVGVCSESSNYYVYEKGTSELREDIPSRCIIPTEGIDDRVEGCDLFEDTEEDIVEDEDLGLLELSNCSDYEEDLTIKDEEEVEFNRCGVGYISSAICVEDNSYRQDVVEDSRDVSQDTISNSESPRIDSALLDLEGIVEEVDTNVEEGFYKVTDDGFLSNGGGEECEEGKVEEELGQVDIPEESKGTGNKNLSERDNSCVDNSQWLGLTIRQYVKRNKGVEYSSLVEIYSASEVSKALKLGKIIRMGSKLFI